MLFHHLIIASCLLFSCHDDSHTCVSFYFLETKLYCAKTHFTLHEFLYDCSRFPLEQFPVNTASAGQFCSPHLTKHTPPSSSSSSSVLKLSAQCRWSCPVCISWSQSWAAFWNSKDAGISLSDPNTPQQHTLHSLIDTLNSSWKSLFFCRSLVVQVLT